MSGSAQEPQVHEVCPHSLILCQCSVRSTETPVNVLFLHETYKSAISRYKNANVYEAEGCGQLEPSPRSLVTDHWLQTRVANSQIKERPRRQHQTTTGTSRKTQNVDWFLYCLIQSWFFFLDSCTDSSSSGPAVISVCLFLLLSLPSTSLSFLVVSKQQVAASPPPAGIFL